jgi:hypothetical protein
MLPKPHEGIAHHLLALSGCTGLLRQNAEVEPNSVGLCRVTQVVKQALAVVECLVRRLVVRLKQGELTKRSRRFGNQVGRRMLAPPEHSFNLRAAQA